MMKKFFENRWNRRLLIVFGVTALAAAAVAGCREHGLGGHPNPERMHQMITWKVDDALDKLDATDDQRTRIHALKDRVLTRGHELHEAARPLKDGFVEEWMKESPNPQTLHGVADQWIDQIRGFAHEVVDALIELHDVLTPAQRAQVAEHVREAPEGK